MDARCTQHNVVDGYKWKQSCLVRRRIVGLLFGMYGGFVYFLGWTRRKSLCIVGARVGCEVFLGGRGNNDFFFWII